MKIEKTFSNILIIISLIFTVLAYIIPWIYNLWINRIYILNNEYEYFMLQIILFQFIHWWMLHLLWNSIFIFIFWNQIEFIQGKKKYIIFFIFNTIFTATSLLLLTSSNTIWISWFAMAILWYYAMIMKEIRHPEYKNALFLLFINVIIWIWTNISLVWHLFWWISWILYFFIVKLTNKHL